MDTGSVNQRVMAFHVRNGSEFVQDGGRLLYATGAFRDQNPLGILAPPPQDDRKRTQLISRFYGIKLALAIEEFDLYKRQHLQQARHTLREKIASPVPQASEVVAKLKELKKKVKKARREWDDAQDAEDNSIPQRQKDLQAMNEKNRAAAENLLTEIDGIEI